MDVELHLLRNLQTLSERLGQAAQCCCALYEKLISVCLFVNCAVYLFWLSAAQQNGIVWLPRLCFVFVLGGKMVENFIQPEH